MNMFVIGNELLIRLVWFFAVFGAMAFWELASPKRVLTAPKKRRWLNNLTVTGFNAAISGVASPVSAVAASFFARQQGLGVFNNVQIGELPAGIVSVIFLDLVIYSQHVAFHRITPFWRLHMVHHTDLDIDVTTGARFHPIEILLSMFIKAAMVIAVGAPAWSVVAFEVLLNATSMFNHGNVSMSLALDRVLRLFVVTPDMHRVHHSVLISETNSNFGFNLPWWDRLFGTYRAQPGKGHTGMAIGLANYRRQEKVDLVPILLMPFTAPRDMLSMYSKGKP